MSGKRCPGCGEVKAVEAFSRDRSKKDGLQCRCKACNGRYHAENREAKRDYHRRYREENREARRDYSRRYHEENREALQEYSRRYREENREAIAESQRRYREENREAIAESQRRYREENREAIAEGKRRYHAEIRDMTLETATRTGEPYTPAEDAHILTSNEPDAAIAVELGRTRASVNGRRKKLRQKAAA